MANSQVLASVCPEIFNNSYQVEEIKSVIIVSLEKFFIDQGYKGSGLENIMRIDPKIALDINLPDGDCKVKVVLVFVRYFDTGFPDEFLKTIESRLRDIGIDTKVTGAKREDINNISAFR
jgi:hypothetical protein